MVKGKSQTKPQANKGNKLTKMSAAAATSAANNNIIAIEKSKLGKVIGKTNKKKKAKLPLKNNKKDHKNSDKDESTDKSSKDYDPENIMKDDGEEMDTEAKCIKGLIKPPVFKTEALDHKKKKGREKSTSIRIIGRYYKEELCKDIQRIITKATEGYQFDNFKTAFDSYINSSFRQGVEDKDQEQKTFKDCFYALYDCFHITNKALYQQIKTEIDKGPYSTNIERWMTKIGIKTDNFQVKTFIEHYCKSLKKPKLKEHLNSQKAELLLQNYNNLSTDLQEALNNNVVTLFKGEYQNQINKFIEQQMFNQVNKELHIEQWLIEYYSQVLFQYILTKIPSNQQISDYMFILVIRILNLPDTTFINLELGQNFKTLANSVIRRQNNLTFIDNFFDLCVKFGDVNILTQLLNSQHYNAYLYQYYAQQGLSSEETQWILDKKQLGIFNHSLYFIRKTQGSQFLHLIGVACNVQISDMIEKNVKTIQQFLEGYQHELKKVNWQELDISLQELNEVGTLINNDNSTSYIDILNNKPKEWLNLLKNRIHKINYAPREFNIDYQKQWPILAENIPLLTEIKELAKSLVEVSNHKFHYNEFQVNATAILLSKKAWCVIGQACTGTGKTIIALLIALYYQRKGFTVTIITLEELINQTRGVFYEYANVVIDLYNIKDFFSQKLNLLTNNDVVIIDEIDEIIKSPPGMLLKGISDQILGLWTLIDNCKQIYGLTATIQDYHRSILSSITDNNFVVVYLQSPQLLSIKATKPVSYEYIYVDDKKEIPKEINSILKKHPNIPFIIQLANYDQFRSQINCSGRQYFDLNDIVMLAQIRRLSNALVFLLPDMNYRGVDIRFEKDALGIIQDPSYGLNTFYQTISRGTRTQGIPKGYVINSVYYDDRDFEMHLQQKDLDENQHLTALVNMYQAIWSEDELKCFDDMEEIWFNKTSALQTVIGLQKYQEIQKRRQDQKIEAQKMKELEFEKIV